jgi:hypothetical protein
MAAVTSCTHRRSWPPPVCRCRRSSPAGQPGASARGCRRTGLFPLRIWWSAGPRGRARSRSLKPPERSSRQRACSSHKGYQAGRERPGQPAAVVGTHDPHAAEMQELADAMAACLLQQAAYGAHIDRPHCHRIACLARQVEDQGNVSGGLVLNGRICQVTDHDRDRSSPRVRHAGRGPRKNLDRMAVLDQALDEMPAGESRSAGDEDRLFR